MKLFAKIIVPIALIAIAFVIFFNRTPNRTIPENGMVSPASGRVIDVRKAESAAIIFKKQGIENQVSVPEITGPVWVILIEMNLSDVHVQRAPIAGRIVRMDHYSGRHKNALGRGKNDLIIENEKTVTVFQDDTDTVGVVQVAGRAARRIRNSKTDGDAMEKGEQYGRIILGSQVVVIIPGDHEPLVQIGDKTIDGETIIAQ